MEKLVEIAKKSGKPSIIFIDEIDGVSTDRDVLKNEDRRDALLLLLEKLEQYIEDENICIIAATNKIDTFDPAIRDRFYKEIEIDLPDYNTRINVLKFYFDQLPEHSKKFNPNTLQQIAELFNKLSNRHLVNFFKFQ